MPRGLPSGLLLALPGVGSELERCGANPAAVARAFVDNCAELRALYSDQCRNMLW